MKKAFLVVLLAGIVFSISLVFPSDSLIAEEDDPGIRALQEEIDSNGYNWIAKRTSLSDLTEEELMGRSRRRAVSVPRQLTMFLIREETDASLPRIGQLLGGRDHTTILHGCDKIGAQIETDEQLRRDWLRIKQTLSEGRNAH